MYYNPLSIKRKSQYGGFNFGDTDDDILTIDVEVE